MSFREEMRAPTSEEWTPATAHQNQWHDLRPCIEANIGNLLRTMVAIWHPEYAVEVKGVPLGTEGSVIYNQSAEFAHAWRDRAIQVLRELEKLENPPQYCGRSFIDRRKDELVDALKEAEAKYGGDTEKEHCAKDDLLLDYIGSDEVRDAFGKEELWYA